MKSFLLTPTAHARDLGIEILDALFEAGLDIRPQPQCEGFPIPWDAGFSVQAGQFVLSGGAGPSGFGSCTVSIPLATVAGNLHIYIWELPTKTVRELDAQGWLVKEIDL